jgi:hypothetical protein
MAEARRGAIALALLYALLAVPNALREEERNWRLTARVRDFVEGVAGAHERHPAQALLLEGVDSDLFWNAMLDRPFRLIGLNSLYLAPGSEREITAYPERGNVSDFVAPAFTVGGAIARGELVVYDVRGPRFRNVTSTYSVGREAGLPRRVDAASPVMSDLMGPEWYAIDSGVRWMARRATLRMGAPDSAGRKLYLYAICPMELVTVSVTAGGIALGSREVRASGSLELAFDLPAALVGRPEMEVAVEVSRVIRPASDPRDFGLAFGVLEVK